MNEPKITVAERLARENILTWVELMCRLGVKVKPAEDRYDHKARKGAKRD